MQLLMAGIEGELTRRIWNAVDRSNPKKWRRAVPERAPHRLPSDRHGQILAKSRELTGD